MIFAPLENCSDVHDNVRDSDVRAVESKIKSTEESMSVSTGMEPGQKAGEKGEKDKEGEDKDYYQNNNNMQNKDEKIEII